MDPHHAPYVFRFCWQCICHWADQETRCPLCKQRFATIKRKAIYLGDPFADQPPGKRHKASNNSTSTSTSRHTAGDLTAAAAGSRAAAVTAAAEAGGGGADGNGGSSGDGSDGGCSAPESPKGQLDGVVLEVKRVAAKDQVFVYEGDDAQYADFLQALRCMVCGAGDNEEHLLICDGEWRLKTMPVLVLLLLLLLKLLLQFQINMYFNSPLEDPNCLGNVRRLRAMGGCKTLHPVRLRSHQCE